MTFLSSERRPSQVLPFTICLLASFAIGNFVTVVGFYPTPHFVLGMTAMPMTMFSAFILAFDERLDGVQESRRRRFWGRISALSLSLSLSCIIIESSQR